MRRQTSRLRVRLVALKPIMEEDHSALWTVKVHFCLLRPCGISFEIIARRLSTLLRQMLSSAANARAETI